jgi:hypothetical protein
MKEFACARSFAAEPARPRLANQGVKEFGRAHSGIRLKYPSGRCDCTEWPGLRFRPGEKRATKQPHVIGVDPKKAAGNPVHPVRTEQQGRDRAFRQREVRASGAGFCRQPALRATRRQVPTYSQQTPVLPGASLGRPGVITCRSQKCKEAHLQRGHSDPRAAAASVGPGCTQLQTRDNHTRLRRAARRPPPAGTCPAASAELPGRVLRCILPEAAGLEWHNLVGRNKHFLRAGGEGMTVGRERHRWDFLTQTACILRVVRRRGGAVSSLAIKYRR